MKQTQIYRFIYTKDYSGVSQVTYFWDFEDMKHYGICNQIR
jgi:hypothetical protein